ncbi:unnamed protein product [Darwinula stevensoni]|uniref:Branchpoint-bridging protein n=1 Tax=Darwinula stevensoni TaxID=69355 RepID=A0A7R9FRN9_9CRUS|nr:unnamed protein product [Darwinula stevensoni]CAG0901674.1 unnamed protein product [Darwinula stevensoni]
MGLKMVGTGGNTVPLGRTAPSFSRAGDMPSLLNPSYLQGACAAANAAAKRFNESAGISEVDESSSDRKRRRKSRWADDTKSILPGMPTVLPSNLSKEQEEAYLLQLQIEEITLRLRTGDLGIPPNPEDRSPSPEPIYNHEGKRLNTREYRTRKKLEEERHKHVQRMFQINPEYKPPPDYKPPIVKVFDKVMIPQDEHPEINFVGLLIGPRGNTLKSMEKETGAKIIIRGKGSVKEGKVGRKDGQPLPGEDEPLHAYITAHNHESVKKAVDKIKEVISQGIEVPEGQNDLRRMQLRELALLNGTLRELDGPRCSNCGAATHKSWQCPDKPNVTTTMVCMNCGGAGHLARDCRFKRPGTDPNSNPYTFNANKSKIDEEYSALMAELGEGPPPSKTSTATTTSSTGTTTTSNSYNSYSGSTNRYQSPSSYGSRFNRPQYNQHGPPSGWGMQQNSGTQYPAMTPPWQQGGNQGQMRMPYNYGPPSSAQNANAMPPWQTTCGYGVPPSTTAPPPWGMTPQWPQPNPVPPPPTRPPNAQSLPWQPPLGVPPPPPPPPEQTQDQQLPQQQGNKQQGNQGIDLNALAQAGLPSLLTAPPPPPPS